MYNLSQSVFDNNLMILMSLTNKIEYRDRDISIDSSIKSAQQNITLYKANKNKNQKIK